MSETIKEIDVSCLHGQVVCSTIHPNKKYIAVGTELGQVEVFGAYESPSPSPPGVSKGPVQLLAFNADGHLLSVREWMLCVTEFNDRMGSRVISATDLRTPGIDYGQVSCWIVNNYDLVIGTNTGYVLSFRYAAPKKSLFLKRMPDLRVDKLEWLNPYMVLVSTPGGGLSRLTIGSEEL